MSVSGAEGVRALLRAGFAQVGQRGSHVKLRHADGRIVFVPLHRELRRGTLQSILRQAKMTLEQLMAHL